MRRLLRPAAAATCWLLAVVLAAFLIQGGQQSERQFLIERFAGRAHTSADFVSAYVGEVFDRERRIADAMRQEGLGIEPLAGHLTAGGFAAAVLLDADGRVTATGPPDPPLAGAAL